MYEAQGAKMVDKFLAASEALAQIYADTYVSASRFEEGGYSVEALDLWMI